MRAVSCHDLTTYSVSAVFSTIGTTIQYRVETSVVGLRFPRVRSFRAVQERKDSEALSLMAVTHCIPTVGLAERK